MITEVLTWLTEFSLNLIDQFGYVGIAIISFLENVFTPIPSEAVLPFAGVLATQGRMNPLTAWVASMVGGVLGSLVFYYLGYWLGVARVYDFVGKYGKWVFLKVDDVTRSEKWFDRFGPASVLLGRLVPQVRSFISIPAGMTKMPLPQFLVLTTIGSGIWNGFLEWLGMYFGENYEVFLPIFRKIDIIFVLVVIALVGYFFWVRVVRKKDEQSLLVPEEKNHDLVVSEQQPEMEKLKE